MPINIQSNDELDSPGGGNSKLQDDLRENHRGANGVFEPMVGRLEAPDFFQSRKISKYQWITSGGQKVSSPPLTSELQISKEMLRNVCFSEVVGLG